MIKVAKVSGGYVAHATPPHVIAEWQTVQAIAVESLIAELRARGAHQTDIGDALFAADPHWIANSN